ncbi:hypothetical protein [Methylobacterium mesophilicum]|uniref:hypothetical protein n=1 Tax=Methylobacterium mesophilicum TaxID=39956 RepID=UPI002F358DC5
MDAFLAVRMLRLARFDLARYEVLSIDADAILAGSRDRGRVSEALAARAGLPTLSAMR